MDDKRYAGRDLERFVQEILEHDDSTLTLKWITGSKNESPCAVHIWRCTRLEHLIDLLQNHALCAALPTQHNIIKIFLKLFRFGGQAVLTEVPTVDGSILDLVIEGES